MKPDTIATRIKQLRGKRGWTRTELGRRIGGKNPRVMVYRWEEALAIPSVDNVARLAAVFDVPVTEIDPKSEAWTPESLKKPRIVDNPTEVRDNPHSVPTTTAEGPMKEQIDAVIGALGIVDEDQRPAFVKAVKRMAARMLLGMEDAGDMPAKRRRASGDG
jgi:transcriptional regulator with XRE-family HTH domain